MNEYINTKLTVDKDDDDKGEDIRIAQPPEIIIKKPVESNKGGGIISSIRGRRFVSKKP
jgi:hypothetical protein